jgi:hypothetical protein
MHGSSKEGNKIGVYEAIAYCLGDIVGSGKPLSFNCLVLVGAAKHYGKIFLFFRLALGIFVSPTAILRHSGSVGTLSINLFLFESFREKKNLGLSLCIWVGGALIAVIGALVYVELGTCIRKSGCDFAYLSHVRW